MKILKPVVCVSMHVEVKTLDFLKLQLYVANIIQKSQII